MQKITSVAELKNAIQILENEQRVKGNALKEQVLLTYESLKPVNLIKNTIKELISSTLQVENISGAAAGMLSGYLMKKLFVGKSTSPFKKLLGLVFQYGITNLMAQNSAVIKSAGLALFQYFRGKKK
jgi:hypothetical protein